MLNGHTAHARDQSDRLRRSAGRTVRCVPLPTRVGPVASRASAARMATCHISLTMWITCENTCMSRDLLACPVHSPVKAEETCTRGIDMPSHAHCVADGTAPVVRTACVGPVGSGELALHACIRSMEIRTPEYTSDRRPGLSVTMGAVPIMQPPRPFLPVRAIVS